MAAPAPAVAAVAQVASAAPAAPAAQPGPPAHLAPVALPRQMRVSVKTSVRDPGLFIARPLADGQALPAGTHEAVLMLVDPSGEPHPGAP